MTVDQVEAHRARIIDQFSQQAAPLSEVRGGSHDEAIRQLLAATKVTADDVVLDVACGTGQVVTAFAHVAKHVTGMDLTPAMIDRAQALQAETKAENVHWLVGDINQLPFENAAFSVVTCRYAFHHVLEPTCIVAEMVRVCRPGGRVALVDVVTTRDKRSAYDGLERLRDPSHVSALTIDELVGLAEDNGLRRLTRQFYNLDVELAALLRASFPAPGDERIVYELIVQDLDRDTLGIGVHHRGSDVFVSYPIAMIVGNVAA